MISKKQDLRRYDLIIIGSGNGACAFLSHYLAQSDDNARVLVLERGDNFFNTSDITHQINWTKSYAEGNIFKLHNALTPDGKPIVSGWACTMGGGGSINYTMIHESSSWLAKNLGHDESYWDELKVELNAKFQRPDPSINETPVTQHILEAGEAVGFEAPNPNHRIENIPSYQDYQSYCDRQAKQLYQFPTQFNPFGQRTHSGVSIVDWDDPRLELKTRCQVEFLEFAPIDSAQADPQADGSLAQCVAVQARFLDSDDTDRIRIPLASGGKVILCAGAASPRLLMPHRQTLQNEAIGQQASDHIVLPLGIYLLDKDLKVLPKDVYGPVFATTVWQPEDSEPGTATVCCFDFFTGNFEKLWYIVSHLYLAFLLPNCVKRVVLRTPWLFAVVKNSVRILISILNFFINLGAGIIDLLNGRPWAPEKIELITAIVKYNPARTGEYEDKDSRITLDFFAEDETNQKTQWGGISRFNQDKTVAKIVIAQQLPLMEQLGSKPPGIVQCIFRCLTKIPFTEEQVDSYVEAYSKRFLLSEQHMAGGCLFGRALDLGEGDRSQTGKVKGSSNVHVADLSAAPLPRISPQMTAYLVGFHVAKQLYPERSN